MKNLRLIISLIILSTTLLGCSPDDNNLHQDCYTCTNTLTEYCITEGDNFYTASVNGAASTQIPLNGEYWSDVVAQLESDCDNAPQRDCFTCNDTNSTYCYLDGDDFYTTSVNNATPTETLLDGMSWADIREGLVQNCTDVEEDCYTCESSSAVYCFIDGNTFYTANVNGNETQIELNGMSWVDIREGLENDCNSDQTTSIVGIWNLVNYEGVATAVTHQNSTTTTLINNQIGSEYNTILTFFENPNNYTSVGGFNNHYTITDDNNDVTEQDVYADLNINGEYSLNNMILNLSTNTGESIAFTIIILNETTLKLKIEDVVEDDIGNGDYIETTLDYTYIYERQ